MPIFNSFRDKLVATLLINSICLLLFSSLADAQSNSDWYMAGANPQRTSWVSEGVTSDVDPLWYTPFGAADDEYVPYVNPKVQVITANNLLYISTSRGLYALSASSGNVVWVYPTEMPLGHSPTVIGSYLYVGSYDNRIHKIQANPNISSLPTDSATGQKINNQVIWRSESADAGFETNPLVVNGVVYAGSRDGNFYAFNDSSGSIKWKYKAGGPILFSAAISTDNSTLYFAANDAYAYALNTSNGTLKWKSAKLPGAGFHSYWPVVYQNYVIFTNSLHYAYDVPWQMHYQHIENPAVYAGVPDGEYMGPNINHNIDVTRAINYFNNNPVNKHYLVLNASNGSEAVTSPFMWTGTHSGNKPPPAVGQDGYLYQSANYIAATSMSGGNIAAWKPGENTIREIFDHNSSCDEPETLALGGNMAYYMQWFGNDSRAARYTTFGAEYNLLNYDNLSSMFDDFGSRRSRTGYERGYDHINGSPPIPYNGMVYTNNFQIENQNVGIVGWSTSASGAARRNSPARVIDVQDTGIKVFSDTELKQKLAFELQKMIAAGHLRSGYHAQGLSDDYDTSSYFANPSETFIALGQAWEVLKDDSNYTSLVSQLKSYLQSEYSENPPQSVSHIGWSGAKREVYDMMPELEADLIAKGKDGGSWSNNCYALWKYAKMGLASASSMRNACKLHSDNTDYATYPYALNREIAGYIGACELEKMSGSSNCSVQNNINNLMATRASIWDVNNGDDRSIIGARNFMNLVPELGEYLSNYQAARNAFTQLNNQLPGWFVSKYDVTAYEGIHQKLYDYWAGFQAKAYVMKASRAELSKYLDVPAFERGDLYYIQNLVATLNAPYSGPEPSLSPTPPSDVPGDTDGDGDVDIYDYITWLNHYDPDNIQSGGASIGDFDDNGYVDIYDYIIWLNNYTG